MHATLIVQPNSHRICDCLISDFFENVADCRNWPNAVRSETTLGKQFADGTIANILATAAPTKTPHFGNPYLEFRHIDFPVILSSWYAFDGMK